MPAAIIAIVAILAYVGLMHSCRTAQRKCRKVKRTVKRTFAPTTVTVKYNPRTGKMIVR